MANASPADRRRWPLFAAAAIFAIFILTHLVVFQLVVRRFQAALKSAEAVGLEYGPSHTVRLAPPLVYQVLSKNSLPAEAVEQRLNSGTLASDLVADITRLAGKHGMELTLIEPGAVSVQPSSVKIGARLRMVCGYRQLVAFLDDLARSREMLAVDRLTLSSPGSGPRELELWVSRLVLKQSRRPE